MDTNFELRLVSYDELDLVRSFYRSYIGKPGSTWNEYYPNEEILQEDFATQNLYGLYKNEKLVGAISVSSENHLDNLPCWTITNNVKEIARVVISESHQGLGYGATMLELLFSHLRQQGTTAIHLLVSLDNDRAKHLYRKLNFENRGQFYLYEHDYYALEAQL